jgi:hypothetical protein
MLSGTKLNGVHVGGTAVLFTLLVVGLVATSCKTSPSPPAAGLASPVAAASSTAPSAPPGPAPPPVVAAPPRTSSEVRRPLERADGPFPSLRAYCAWFTKDCVPGDARLCRCKVRQGAAAGIASVAVRDLGRERDLARQTDATIHLPAYRTSAGWRVAKRGLEENYAETSAGNIAYNVRFDRHELRDVLGDAAPEHVFWFTQTQEEGGPDLALSAASQTIALIVCEERSPWRCAEPISARVLSPWDAGDAGASPSAPTPRKDAYGRLVIEGPSPGEGPVTYDFSEKNDSAE